ncbi:MAG: bacterial Ig-like domain-containing protein, partial [Clostridia bacterium]
IKIKTPASKLIFITENIFSSEGLVVEKIYSDGTKVDAPSNEITINSDAFSNTVIGTYTIVITLKSDPTKTVSYDVSVIAATLTGIRIKTPASKLAFPNGDAFSSEGLVVEKVFNNNTFVTLLANEITINSAAFSSAVAGTYTIVITLNSDTTKTVSYDVSVSAPYVTGITIKTPASKLAFITGDPFSSAGLVVEKTYNTGAKADATADEIAIDSTAFSNTVGTYTIVITLKSDTTKTVSYDVLVKEKAYVGTYLTKAGNRKSQLVEINANKTADVSIDWPNQNSPDQQHYPVRYRYNIIVSENDDGSAVIEFVFDSLANQNLPTFGDIKYFIASYINGDLEINNYEVTPYLASKVDDKLHEVKFYMSDKLVAVEYVDNNSTISQDCLDDYLRPYTHYATDATGTTAFDVATPITADTSIYVAPIPIEGEQPYVGKYLIKMAPASTNGFLLEITKSQVTFSGEVMLYTVAVDNTTGIYTLTCIEGPVITYNSKTMEAVFEGQLLTTFDKTNYVEMTLNYDSRVFSLLTQKGVIFDVSTIVDMLGTVFFFNEDGTPFDDKNTIISQPMTLNVTDDDPAHPDLSFFDNTFMALGHSSLRLGSWNPPAYDSIDFYFRYNNTSITNGIATWVKSATGYTFTFTDQQKPTPIAPFTGEYNAETKDFTISYDNKVITFYSEKYTDSPINQARLNGKIGNDFITFSFSPFGIVEMNIRPQHGQQTTAEGLFTITSAGKGIFSVTMDFGATGGTKTATYDAITKTITVANADGTSTVAVGEIYSGHPIIKNHFTSRALDELFFNSYGEFNLIIHSSGEHINGNFTIDRACKISLRVDENTVYDATFDPSANIVSLSYKGATITFEVAPYENKRFVGKFYSNDGKTIECTSFGEFTFVDGSTTTKGTFTSKRIDTEEFLTFTANGATLFEGICSDRSQSPTIRITINGSDVVFGNTPPPPPAKDPAYWGDYTNTYNKVTLSLLNDGRFVFNGVRDPNYAFTESGKTQNGFAITLHFSSSEHIPAEFITETKVLTFTRSDGIIYAFKQQGGSTVTTESYQGIYSDTTTGNSLNLAYDYTFELNIGGAKSYGNYKVTPAQYDNKVTLQFVNRAPADIIATVDMNFKTINLSYNNVGYKFNKVGGVNPPQPPQEPYYGEYTDANKNFLMLSSDNSVVFEQQDGTIVKGSYTATETATGYDIVMTLSDKKVIATFVLSTNTITFNYNATDYTLIQS